MAVLHLEAQVSTEELLQIGISGDVSDRYEELIARRREGTLSAIEYEELLHLTEQVETLDAARAEQLASLARVRGVSLGALLDDLGIQAPEHE